MLTPQVITIIYYHMKKNIIKKEKKYKNMEELDKNDT